MKPMTVMSIHSLKRIGRELGWLFLGIVLISFCVALLPHLIGASTRGNSEAPALVPFLTVWCTIVSVFGVACESYSRYLWANHCGALTISGRIGRRLVWAPVLALSGIGVIALASLSGMNAVLWLVLCISLGVVTILLRDPNTPELRSLWKLKHALSPVCPAGTPGADPWETGANGAGLHIIIVRGIPDSGLLRILEAHKGVRSFRVIPEYGFFAILCEEYPSLRNVLPRILETEIELTEFEDIDLVINRWASRSNRPWQGMLDDGTVLVHNDWETRIVPADEEQFELYRSLLRKHGHEIALEKYYVQAGDKVVVESCT